MSRSLSRSRSGSRSPASTSPSRALSRLTPASADLRGVSPSEQVETELFRALVVLRLVVMTYALVLNLGRFGEFARPGLAAAGLVVIVAWTGFASWAYDAPRRRRTPLYAADLGVSLLLMLATPLVQSQEMLDRHASTLPSFYVVAPVLAWAVGRHVLQAVLAAVLVSAADVSVRESYSGSTWGNIFLLLLAAAVVGWTAGILREAAEMRAAAERTAAIHAERARLARVVHDGVLQVLALVQRHGTEVGGDLAELGRLSGEQEVALRALVQFDARTGPDLETGGDAGDPGVTDLVAALTPLSSPRVSVSVPGVPVRLTAHAVSEVAAVVAACLDNVDRHVGADAPAWVFVEDLGDAVEVTVRDEGPGIPAGRLEQAEREGRLGVSGSVRGRMTDLGGSAEQVGTPGEGTEWLLVLPRGDRTGEGTR